MLGPFFLWNVFNQTRDFLDRREDKYINDWVPARFQLKIFTGVVKKSDIWLRFSTTVLCFRNGATCLTSNISTGAPFL